MQKNLSIQSKIWYEPVHYSKFDGGRGQEGGGRYERGCGEDKGRIIWWSMEKVREGRREGPVGEQGC